MPCSDLEIAAGATSTASATVNVDFDFVNRGTIPADEVAFSNDGATWIGGSTARTRSWSLIDPAGGGTNTDGTKTVWAKWRQGVWWSDPVQAHIELHRSVLTVTAPSRTIPAGTALSGAGVPSRLAWTGSDSQTGIASFRMERRVDGGAWTTVVGPTSSTSWTGNLTANHIYQFRVTATNGAGVTKTATGSSFKLTSISDGSSSLSWAGTWRVAESTSFLGSKVHYATTAGAKVTFTTSKRGLAWLAAVGPTRGSARIYVDGTLVKTVSLYASSNGYRHLAFSTTWTTSKTRKIIIKVVGTSGHPRVDVDGLLAWD
jgi:hypothetical protein